MPSKPQKKARGGAPEWMTTYGDMVTLLLAFFVMIVAMMEMKQEQKLAEFMSAIREAFGYVGGARHLPLDPVELPKNVDFQTVLQIPVHMENFSPTKDEGPTGERTRVDTLREADHYRAGGKFVFKELSAEIPEAERERLSQFGETLRGYTTQVEIRGHCNRRPVEGTEFADHFELSFRRANAVKDALTQAGVDPARVIIVVAAANEPIAVDGYDPAAREKNDFVEVLQLDRDVSEFE